MLDHQAQELPVRHEGSRKRNVSTNLFSLAAVNFFLGVVGVVQCSRILMWQQSQKSVGDLAKDVKEDVKEAVSS